MAGSALAKAKSEPREREWALVRRQSPAALKLGKFWEAEVPPVTIFKGSKKP